MFILYIIILGVGLAASYTDIKFKKIKNKHLIPAIFSGCVALGYMISTQQIECDLNTLWNILISLGIGLGLYLTDLWGAGDAKLFALFCFLMPVGKYPKLIPFPSIAVFANIFIISFLIIAIISAKNAFNNRWKILKEFFSIKTLSSVGKSFLIIFSINQIVKSCIHFLIPESSNFIVTASLFVFYKFIKRRIKKIKNKFALIFSSGLLFNVLFYPEIFQSTNLIIQFKRVAAYTLIFHAIYLFFSPDKPSTADAKETSSMGGINTKTKILPFAPLMLVGTLLTNTNFLNWVTLPISALKNHG